MADWTAIGSVGAVVISGVGTYLVYRRGEHGDEALAVSHNADRRSQETETNLTIQGGIIDNLQEEVARYRVELHTRASELEAKHTQLEEARSTIRDMRHEMVNYKAGLDAAKVVIESLENTVEVLQAEVASLRRLVQDHEQTIAGHERTINELRAKDVEESR